MPELPNVRWIWDTDDNGDLILVGIYGDHSVSNADGLDV
jgi:hypothetical protein